MLWLVMIYWQFIGNHRYTDYVKHSVRLIMAGKKFVHEIRKIVSVDSSNVGNVIKRMKLIDKWLVNIWQFFSHKNYFSKLLVIN